MLISRTCVLLTLSFLVGCGSSSTEPEHREIVDAGSTAQPITLLKVGDRVPEMVVPVLFQSPGRDSVALSDLHGKTIVIEFWATWCAPCIAAIDHLNAVAAEFSSDQEVCFISLSSEEPEVLEKFIAQKEMRSWVGADPSRQFLKAFGVKFIPRTIIINGDGIVAAETTPASLDAGLINDIKKGKILQPATNGVVDRPGVAAKNDNSNTLVQIELRESASGGMSSQHVSKNDSVMLAVSPETLVQRVFGVPDTRVEFEAKLPAKQYDFTTRFPNASSANDELLKHTITAAFGVDVQTQERSVPVIVFRVGEDGAHRLTPTVSNGGSSRTTNANQYAAINAPVSDALSVIESWIDKPVVDETGIEGRFDIKFSRSEGDSLETICDSFAESTGLQWEEAERQIEIFVVSAHAPAASGASPLD